MNRIKQAITVCRELADYRGERMRDYPNFVVIWIFGCGLIGSFVPNVRMTGGMLFGGITYLIFFGLLELKDKLASRSFKSSDIEDTGFPIWADECIRQLKKDVPNKDI